MSAWQVHARLKHLPPESAVHAEFGGAGWAVTDMVICDIYSALVGDPHPADPRVKMQQTRRRDELAEKKARMDRLNGSRKGSVLRRKE